MPFIVISSIIGALIINHLNSRELSFPSEAETSKIEATTDHLTGLVNRRGLDTIFPNLSGASSGNKGRGMLYFDIDRFKLANDSHGHAFGDEVLKQVAERVAGNLRQNDIFARVGGDTSSSLSCQKSAKKEAQHIADRCRSIVVGDLFEIDGKSIPVTISLGANWVH
ncbi:GGDEF domain-containing protein [Octadecabacter sp.]|nr:GGDEF domain-containing protein [Octadecabacter sp.]